MLVTNNGNFYRLYEMQPLHTGLIIIILNVNRVLEADIDGEDVTFNLYSLP